jgi:hypothetical protein
MPRYRVEMEERHTTTREAWIEADTEEAARELADAQDWKTWSEVCRDTHSQIVEVEEQED